MRFRGVKLSGEDLKDRLRLVTQRRPHAFCLNDTVADGIEPKRKARIVARFLERYFPEPSSFER
jgi:hypothetical protein